MEEEITMATKKFARYFLINYLFTFNSLRETPAHIYIYAAYIRA